MLLGYFRFLDAHFLTLPSNLALNRTFVVTMLSKMNLLARRSVPRTASACRSFHVSAPSQNDKESASDDMVTHPPNEGVLGTLFGNPYYSVPICGLGIMTATATDVSVYTIQSKSSLYLYHGRMQLKQLNLFYFKQDKILKNIFGVF